MKQYMIREMSRKFNMPASTLRYYEEIGLLSDVKKNTAGQRIYTQEHAERLECIQCFKKAGMTLSQLREFFVYETDEAKHIDEILLLLTSQLTQVQEQLSQLNMILEHIERKVCYYQDIKSALEAGRARPLWEEYQS